MIQTFSRCFTGPVSLHLLAAHLLTLGPESRQHCLCIFSRQQLAAYISSDVSTRVISQPPVRLGRRITVTARSARSINPKCYLNHVKCHNQE